MFPLFRSSLIAAGFLMLAGQAAAANIPVISYDIPNGSGQANGGSFNYWDKEYTGSGSVTTDGAALSGGVGNLTDGQTTNLNWFASENAAGTGPYVGWLSSVTAKPILKFNFGSSVKIGSITIHLDDSNNTGGVNPPSGIGISTDGANFDVRTIVDPASGDPFAVTFAGLNLDTDAVWLSLFYDNIWIFIDEVSFAEPESGVPEPGVLSLLGLSLVALARRRRQAP